MNTTSLTTIVRSCMPELLIGSACCAAGYFLLVDPLAAKLAQARGEADRLNMAVTRSVPQPTGADQALLTDAQGVLDDIANRSKLATDQARLLQAISTLADETGVRIEQFNPSSPRGPRATPGQTASRPDSRVEQRSAFSISITASYADTARFVQALQQQVGFTAVRNLRLLPATGEAGAAVSVVIDTEHVSVNTTVLAAANAAPSGTPGQPGPQATVPTEQR